MCCPFIFIWGLSELKVFIYFLEECDVLMLVCAPQARDGEEEAGRVGDPEEKRVGSAPSTRTGESSGAQSQAGTPQLKT